jgi:hypothetical protein
MAKRFTGIGMVKKKLLILPREKVLAKAHFAICWISTCETIHNDEQEEFCFVYVKNYIQKWTCMRKITSEGFRG